MPGHITGFHHATMLAASARQADAFLREALGLGRVKTTVNRDEPDAYHLFHGAGAGAPGTLVTTAAFTNLPRGRAGVNEIAAVIFAVRRGTLPHWRDRLEAAGAPILGMSRVDNANRLWFEGPEGQTFALQVCEDDPRVDASGPPAVLGLHSFAVRLPGDEGFTDLLDHLGFDPVERSDGIARFRLRGAGVPVEVEVESVPGGPDARSGAGTFHHVAFAVSDPGALGALRDELVAAGQAPGPEIDGPYFRSVFLRAQGDILIEFATPGPGLAADGEPGDRLALPAEREGERTRLEGLLEPLDA